MELNLLEQENLQQELKMVLETYHSGRLLHYFFINFRYWKTRGKQDVWREPEEEPEKWRYLENLINKNLRRVYWKVVNTFNHERGKVRDELQMSGVEQVEMPAYNFVTTYGKSFPIFCTPFTQMLRKDHVMIILPSEDSHCGIWNPELTSGNHNGLLEASVVPLVKYLRDKWGKRAPGLIILNPGELIWIANYEYKIKRAVSRYEAQAFPHPVKTENLDEHDGEYIIRHQDVKAHFWETLRNLNGGTKMVAGGLPQVDRNANLSLVIVDSNYVDGIIEEWHQPSGPTPVSEMINFFPRLKAVAFVGKAPKDRSDHAKEADIKSVSKAWLRPVKGENHPLDQFRQGSLGIDTKYVDPKNPRTPNCLIARCYEQVVDHIMEKVEKEAAANPPVLNFPTF